MLISTINFEWQIQDHSEEHTLSYLSFPIYTIAGGLTTVYSWWICDESTIYNLYTIFQGSPVDVKYNTILIANKKT